MEDTISGVMSPYLTSQIADTTMIDQLNHADTLNFHQQRNQMIQGETFRASCQPRARGRGAKLDDAQKREKKRQRDIKYRQNQKIKVDNLTAENKHLREIIERLNSKYLQFPTIDPQIAENFVSHSATLDYDPNLYILDRQGLAYGIEGTADELEDGLGLDDLDDQLSDGLTVKDPVHEVPISQDIQANIAMAEFLMKIDEDVASNVDIPDFKIWLEGEHKTIGKYNFPLALVPTVERIINVYGDISAACLMNPSVTGQVYLFFCAAIKEMEDMELCQVTEEKMLKWRDAIKDALRINFKVDFAVSHLKKIARGYFGRIGSQVLHGMDEKLKALQKERAETYEGFKYCLADAKAFYGKSVSTGLFP